MKVKYSSNSFIISFVSLITKLLGIVVFMQLYSKLSPGEEFVPERWLEYLLYFGALLGLFGVLVSVFAFVKKQTDGQSISGLALSSLAIIVNPMVYSI